MRYIYFLDFYYFCSYCYIYICIVIAIVISALPCEINGLTEKEILCD